MPSEFWNAAAQASAGPLTQEDLDEAIDGTIRALRRPPELVVPIMPAWWVREQRAKLLQ